MRHSLNRVFDHRNDEIIRTRHDLDHKSTGRRYKGLFILQKNTKQNSRRYLFRLGKIKCKILGDLPGDDGPRPDVRLLMQANVEARFTDDIKRSLADNAANVEF